jgi:hypothetical protein
MSTEGWGPNAADSSTPQIHHYYRGRNAVCYVRSGYQGPYMRSTKGRKCRLCEKKLLASMSVAAATP